MSPIIGTVLLAFTTLLCAFTTFAATASPSKFAAALGFGIANAGGTNEIRAQYAGFFLLMGLATAAALVGVLPRSTAFVICALVFGGLFVGRVAGVVLNGGVGGYCRVVRSLIVIDTVGTLLSVAALMTSRTPLG